MSSLDAPAARFAEASKAARTFSLTINLASRRALLPPRISFIIRNAMTPFASSANIIKELNMGIQVAAAGIRSFSLSRAASRRASPSVRAPRRLSLRRNTPYEKSNSSRRLVGLVLST